MEENRALIIVDVQPTFCEGGALAVKGGNAVAEKIADFVSDNLDEYSFIVTTQDWHSMLFWFGTTFSRRGRTFGWT